MLPRALPFFIFWFILTSTLSKPEKRQISPSSVSMEMVFRPSTLPDWTTIPLTGLITAFPGVERSTTLSSSTLISEPGIISPLFSSMTAVFYTALISSVSRAVGSS